MFGGNFAPQGWALCNGQLLSISENTALFSILGTNYGGNGTSTFGLPNLQGRVAIHQGTGPSDTYYDVGVIGGAASVNLLTENLPSHSHALMGVAAGGTQASPAGALPAIESTGTSLDYSISTATTPMNSNAIGNTGSGMAVATMPPFLTVTFIIALVGIYPTRS